MTRGSNALENRAFLITRMHVAFYIEDFHSKVNDTVARRNKWATNIYWKATFEQLPTSN